MQKTRTQELSTKAGSALVIGGVASIIEGLSSPKILDFDEGAAVADTLGAVGHALMSGDFLGGMAAVLMGAYSIWKRETE